MNGWTPETAQVTRIENLFAQIPQEYRAIASRKCYGENDHDFERKLTGYVLSREWEQHPADVAFDLEALPESEQVAAEVENDSRWLDSASVSESWQAEAEAEHADWLDAKQMRNYDLAPFPLMPDIDINNIDEIPF